MTNIAAAFRKVGILLEIQKHFAFICNIELGLELRSLIFSYISGSHVIFGQDPFTLLNIIEELKNIVHVGYLLLIFTALEIKTEKI